MKFVIWGTGKRAERLLYFIKSEDIVCFVDTKKDIFTFYDKDVINLETYFLRYKEYPIIISFLFEQDAIKTLKKNNVENYFILSDCPGEFQTSNPQDVLKEYIQKNIDIKTQYHIYGNNWYTLYVYDLVKEKCDTNPIIVYDKKMSLKKISSLKKIGYICKKCTDILDCENLLFCDYIDRKHKDELLRNSNVHYLYDVSDKIETYYNDKIERYKNIHVNEKCFIVATGPSIKKKDLETLQRNNILTISMNEIWKLFSMVSWRPDYYVADDPESIRLILPYIKNFSINTYFLGDTYKDIDKYTLPDNVLKHHFNYDFVKNRLPDFSQDFSRQCYMGSSVTYSCIQLAAYMGIKKIYLLGVDFSYATTSEPIKYSHCYGESNLSSTGYSEYVRKAYLASKKYADENNIKIYNATRGGKLEIFERVDFDSLFKEKD